MGDLPAENREHVRSLTRTIQIASEIRRIPRFTAIHPGPTRASTPGSPTPVSAGLGALPRRWRSPPRVIGGRSSPPRPPQCGDHLADPPVHQRPVVQQPRARPPTSSATDRPRHRRPADRREPRPSPSAADCMPPRRPPEATPEHHHQPRLQTPGGRRVRPAGGTGRGGAGGRGQPEAGGGGRRPRGRPLRPSHVKPSAAAVAGPRPAAPPTPHLAAPSRSSARVAQHPRRRGAAVAVPREPRPPPPDPARSPHGTNLLPGTGSATTRPQRVDQLVDVGIAEIRRRGDAHPRRRPMALVPPDGQARSAASTSRHRRCASILDTAAITRSVRADRPSIRSSRSRPTARRPR